MKQPAIVWASLLIIGYVAVGSWLPGLLPSLEPGQQDLVRLAGSPVTITGRVASYPEPRGDRQRLVVDGMAGGHHGKTLVTVPAGLPLAPGDRLELTGMLQRPPVLPEFDYRAYLAKDGIHSLLNQPRLRRVGHDWRPLTSLYQVRRQFSERLTEQVPGPPGSFLLGILIGDRSGLPEPVAEDFRRTGTTHVLALSGYNISILVSVLIAIVGRRPAGVWMAVATIAAFVVLVGPSASVLRAALMGGFILLAQLSGRPQLAIRACLITAAVMLIGKPWSLRYDVGFDLSFLATLGIIRYEAPLRQRLWWLPRLGRAAVSATLAASLFTLPLIVLTFGQLSLVAPLANALVVPAIPWLMLGGFLTAMTALISPSAAIGPAVMVGLATNGLLTIVHQLASLPAAALEITDHRGLIAGGLLLLTAVIILRIRARGRDSDQTAAVGMAGDLVVGRLDGQTPEHSRPSIRAGPEY